MEKHITILGVFYIVFCVLGILTAMIVFVVVTGSGLLLGVAITAGVGSAIAFFLVLVSVPEAIGGIWLLKRKSWARTLVLILGFLNLLNIPFGTALGIYTIWVLRKDETARLFASTTHE